MQSGYQFIHLNAYGRVGGLVSKTSFKINIWDVANEAERCAGAISHILNPQQPNIVFGCSPSQAASLADQWAAKAKDLLGRRLRKDGLCLAAGVISLPVTRADDWPSFRDASIKYLHTMYGDRLKSVVEHLDESHPHIHFYLVPHNDERFEDIHCGYKAAATAKLSGGVKGVQNSAYKQAMRDWQDSFYKHVCSAFGLTRIGPGRRRLSRGEWRSEQLAVQLLGKKEKDKPVQVCWKEINNNIKHIISNPAYYFELGKEAGYNLSQIKEIMIIVAKVVRRLQFNSNINAYHVAMEKITALDESNIKLSTVNDLVISLTNENKHLKMVLDAYCLNVERFDLPNPDGCKDEVIIEANKELKSVVSDSNRRFYGKTN